MIQSCVGVFSFISRGLFRFTALGVFTAGVTILAARSVGSEFQSAASSTSTESIEASLVVRRGLGAELEFTHPSESIVVRSDQPIDGPVLARLENLGVAGGEVVDRGERTAQTTTSNDKSHYRYLVRFFGTEAGIYNLATLLTIDGQSLADRGEGKEEFWVQIVSDLPASRGADLYELDDPELFTNAGYRRWATVIVALWSLIPVVVFLARKKPAIVSEPDTRPALPSPRERVEKLVHVSALRTLNSDEKAELELLLCLCLAEGRDLPRSLISAIPRLRREPGVGEQLIRLERLLHSGDTDLAVDEHSEYKKVLGALGVSASVDERSQSSPVGDEQAAGSQSDRQLAHPIDGGSE